MWLLEYLLTDLTGGRLYSPTAWGLNNYDQSVGDAPLISKQGLAGGPRLGWVTIRGALEFADEAPGALSTSFLAVNDGGDSAGWWLDENNVSHAFLYQQGRFTDLHPRLGEGWSVARDINNNGVVVGSFGRGTWDLNNPQEFGFIYDPGSSNMVVLGPLAGLTTSRAAAINAHGDVVGTCSDGNTRRPFLYTGGGMQELTGQPGSAVDINDHGHVVGAGQDLTPFFWADGNLVPIPVLGSGSALNNSDEVVGTGSNGGYGFAWRFTTTDGLLDLNTALAENYGTRIDQAYDINDQGHIAVSGTDTSKNGHAVLLTPHSPLRGPRRFLGPGNIVALVADILFGITQDGAGLARLGNTPVPVGPWGELNERRREQLEAKTLEILGPQIDIPELRQQAFQAVHQIIYGAQE